MDIFVTTDAGLPCTAYIGLAGVSAFPGYVVRNAETGTDGHVQLTMPAEPARLEDGNWSMFSARNVSTHFPCGVNAPVMFGGNASGPISLTQVNNLHVKVGADRIRPDADVNGLYFTRGAYSMDTYGVVYFNGDETFAGNQSGALLEVNDQLTETTGFWIEEIGGRGARVDAPVIQPITVKRHMYVPPGDAWYRTLDDFTNESSSPVTIRVKRSYLHQFDDGSTEVAETSSGDDVVDVTDSYAILQDSYWTYAYIAQKAPPTATDLSFANARLNQEWTLTIPAGGHASLLTFAFVRPPGDIALARATAQSLANLTATDAITGLTVDDLAHIVNFQ